MPFHDSDSARHLTHATGVVPSALGEALPGLLAMAPDPDSAVLLFDRLVSESSAEVVRLLGRHAFLAHYAIVVFGNSRFLGETLIQNTDLLHSFLREKDLGRSLSREELHEAFARFRSRSFDTDVPLLLTRFKRREYVRIMLRDVLRIAPLAETTAEISALADVLIEEALWEAQNRLQRRYDPPQHLDSGGRLVDTPFSILALGKLGGNELNYSSDIDLMYIFGDGEAPPAASHSNREYFIRLAQQVTEILSQITREGPVFRIDMRLRPQGSEGELAVSIAHALRYYASGAHDWERQALIKVRHCAGDAALARQFMRGVQPHVYTDQVNFEAIETALDARAKMHRHRHRNTHSLERPGETTDIKLDRGGIRDIEFLVQCLQRVYGGAEPWLRSGGTLFSLQKLHDKRHISGSEFQELTKAYEFFRHLEHRLQLRQGQQTHRLPTDERELRILQRAMEPYSAGRYQLHNVREFVGQRMAAVAEIYQRIIHHQQTRKGIQTPEVEFELRSRREPGSDRSNQQILERLAADSPALYAIVSQELSPHLRKNLFRFLTASFTSSERYKTLMRHAAAVERALRLFEASEYLTEILIRYPEEIGTLAELGEINARAGSGYLFESPLGQGSTLGDPVFAYLANAPTSYEERLSLLRQHYRHRVFAAGAKDVTESREVYSSLAVATAAAEDAVGAAFGIVGEPEQLAVMALGRLGNGEFDLLSDADLLFVCSEEGDREALTKTAEQMIQALAAYTQDGMVFPVDPRLRPRGAEGELLISPTQLAAYFEQEAQPWEALTYTKLRFLVGSRPGADRATAAVQLLYNRFARDPEFLAAIRDMRSRLEAGSERNFKTSPGGIYDIDFLSSFLLVKHGIADKQGTLRDRLWRCAACGVLDKAEAATLDHAAELLRTLEHTVRLVIGRPHKWLPASEHASKMMEDLASNMLRHEFPDGIETELLRTCGIVREVYSRLLR